MVKKRPTAYNTAYTLRASPLPFGTLLPAVATSYMLETLYEIVPPPKKGYLKIQGELV